MHLGYTYWIIMWVAMSIAFLLAWLFIVKGCEVLDRKTKIDERAEAKRNV